MFLYIGLWKKYTGMQEIEQFKGMVNVTGLWLGGQVHAWAVWALEIQSKWIGQNKWDASFWQVQQVYTNLCCKLSANYISTIQSFAEALFFITPK